MDKVINVINNNYRTAFNHTTGNNDTKENTKGVNKKQTKKKSKTEKTAPEIRTVQDDERSIKEEVITKVEVNLLSADKNISISDANATTSIANEGSCQNESIETTEKDVDRKVANTLDNSSNNAEDETMEEDDDESFKFELDENLDVFTDIPENNDNVLEKGFQYFHRDGSKNSSKKSKDKSKKCKRKNKTDENLELLNEWKMKVSETRKNCKDIVKNLKLKTDQMKSKSTGCEMDWNGDSNENHGIKRLNLPSEVRKDNIIKAIPTVREAIKKQKLLHSAKTVTMPSSKTPEIKSPIMFSNSPTHGSNSATTATFSKSPSPKSVSPNRGFYSPLGIKSPLVSPHSSPRHSNSIFPDIKPNKSPENLFAVGMSLKCFTNKDQMITA